MALNYISIILSIITIIVDVIIFFFLVRIKSKVYGRFKKIIIYLMFVVITLILLRTQTILNKTQILIIPYSQEVLALILALLVFLVAFNIYKSVSEISGGKRIKRKEIPKKTYSRDNVPQARKRKPKRKMIIIRGG